MIVDEVMAGVGRTGEWFAVDHWDVVPDMIVMAKGLTSAYMPLGFFFFFFFFFSLFLFSFSFFLIFFLFFLNPFFLSSHHHNNTPQNKNNRLCRNERKNI